MRNRVMTPELMDRPDASREELDGALEFIRKVNQSLGGTSGLVRWLQRWSPNWPTDRPITLLDLGTGSADIPAAARSWAIERGYDLRVTALDVHETTLDLARDYLAHQPERVREGIELVRADVFDAVDRFGADSFDYTHAGMFLHHFAEVSVLTILRIMERLAARGLVWNDLSRTRLAHAAIKLLTRGQNEMVRHDAVVSVEKGFTRREVIDYQARLGLDWCAYRGRFLTQRFELAGEKPGAWEQ